MNHIIALSDSRSDLNKWCSHVMSLGMSGVGSLLAKCSRRIRINMSHPNNNTDVNVNIINVIFNLLRVAYYVAKLFL